MDITSRIIQAAGGTAGGMVVSGGDMGRVGNLTAGAVGGIGGGTLLGGLLGAAHEMQQAEWTSEPWPANRSMAVFVVSSFKPLSV